MYSLLVQMLDPYTFLLLGLVIATIWQWRHQKPRTLALKIGSSLLGLFVVLSTPVAGQLALRSLESSVVPAAGVPAGADTIVVLSAGLRIDDDAGEHVRLDEPSMQRCRYAARLYRQAVRCRLVLTGGKVDWTEPGPTFAAAMRDFLLELGIQPEDMVLEERAASTYENALFSKRLLQKKGEGRIWLVTDAFHMGRAVRCFQVLGIEVAPAPCDYHSRRWRFEPTSLVPSSRGIGLVSRASHEWLGRLWYRLRGRI
ncbi:MAG: YdcF family protein [Deltaproteobacteria bacterium]